MGFSVGVAAIDVYTHRVGGWVVRIRSVRANAPPLPQTAKQLCTASVHSSPLVFAHISISWEAFTKYKIGILSYDYIMKH